MITIVLPVHNGGTLLRRCIESIARQDCPPETFEVVVLDNCSSDGALDALHLLPPGIPRRVVGSERLLPIEQNWARIRELSGVGSFITIVGHDDLFDAGFIRIMSRTLEEEPDVRLLYSHFRLIDDAERTIRPCLPMGASESAGQFLAGRLARTRDSFGTGYVVRFDDYRDVGGIPPYAKLMYADHTLWLTLARRSRIRILEEQSFSYRLHAANTSQTRESGLILRAFSDYLAFLGTQVSEDAGVLRALATYGPGYVESLAAHWIWEEAARANRADEPMHAGVVDGWRDVHRRVLRLVGRTDSPREVPPEVAFSIWANERPLRRRLWTTKPGRAMMRGVRAALAARPLGAKSAHE
jgi:hypothetical protein